MSNKHIYELRKLTEEELEKKTRDLEEEIVKTRLKKMRGELKNTKRLWFLRKNLARVKTLWTKQQQQTQAKA